MVFHVNCVQQCKVSYSSGVLFSSQMFYSLVYWLLKNYGECLEYTVGQISSKKVTVFFLSCSVESTECPSHLSYLNVDPMNVLFNLNLENLLLVLATKMFRVNHWFSTCALQIPVVPTCTLLGSQSYSRKLKIYWTKLKIKKSLNAKAIIFNYHPLNLI